MPSLVVEGEYVEEPLGQLNLNSSPPLCLEDTEISVIFDWVKPSYSFSDHVFEVSH